MLYLARLVVACLLIAGCGRWGFDEDVNAGDDAPDSSVDAITALEITPARFATASPTFVDVPGGTITIPPSPGRTWLLLVSATLESSSNVDDAPEARYLVDGIERGLGGTESTLMDRPGPWQHFYVFDGKDVPTEITFQLRDALGAITTIDQLRAVVAPLPVAVDPLYASADPITVVNGMTMSTYANFTLAPPEPADYLVFLLVNATEQPGGSDIDYQWLDPTNPVPTVWHTSAFKNPRAAWQSTLVVRRATLGPGTATMRLQASAGTTAQFKYARVLALPTDAFPAFAHQFSEADLSTIEPGVTVAHQFQPTLGPAASYVVLGTMRVDDDCGGMVIAQRGAFFIVDGVESGAIHVAGNCAYETTYGTARLMTTPPQAIAAAISSGNAMPVEHKDSTLVVLGVD